MFRRATCNTLFSRSSEVIGTPASAVVQSGLARGVMLVGRIDQHLFVVQLIYAGIVLKNDNVALSEVLTKVAPGLLCLQAPLLLLLPVPYLTSPSPTFAAGLLHKAKHSVLLCRQWSLVCRILCTLSSKLPGQASLPLLALHPNRRLRPPQRSHLHSLLAIQPEAQPSAAASSSQAGPSTSALGAGPAAGQVMHGSGQFGQRPADVGLSLGGLLHIHGMQRGWTNNSECPTASSPTKVSLHGYVKLYVQACKLQRWYTLSLQSTSFSS